MSQWHADLSMAERLSATMKIMSKYKKAFGELSGIEIQKKARSVEESIYSEALSCDDYQKQCEQAIKEIHVPALSETTSTVTAKEKPDTTPVEQVGPYRGTRHASGLFSTIYRSNSPATLQTIAIKVTTPSMMSPPHHSQREARLLRLAAHETIVPLLSTQSIAGGHFLLIFPFIPHDFGTLLDSHVLSPSEIRSHLYALFSGLAHIHSLSILHRDIKPSNLLLASPSGPAYLADFGIAWRAGDPDSEPSENKITDVGTTSYRPLELLFGVSGYDATLDLWAAGCVVAEALRGGQSLFDAGELGSELALIKSIFETLGTPDENTWPEVKTYPDWGKMQFIIYPPRPWDDIIPGTHKDAMDLVSRLVKYESKERMKASEASLAAISECKLTVN